MYEEKEIKYKKRKKRKTPKKENNFHFIKKESVFFKIDWKKLFSKLIILVGVILLIIFTISRISNSIQEKNKVMNDNLDKITNATLEFFTKDSLPKNIGDSTSLLLDEMINKNIVEPMYDTNQKECDRANSYIILSKISNEEFKLKTYLSCPINKKSKEVIITCKGTCDRKK